MPRRTFWKAVLTRGWREPWANIFCWLPQCLQSQPGASARVGADELYKKPACLQNTSCSSSNIIASTGSPTSCQPHDQGRGGAFWGPRASPLRRQHSSCIQPTTRPHASKIWSNPLCFVSCLFGVQLASASKGWSPLARVAPRREQTSTSVRRSLHYAHFVMHKKKKKKASGKKRINKTSPKWLLCAVSGSPWLKQHRIFPWLPRKFKQKWCLKNSKSVSFTSSTRSEESVWAPKS